MNTTETTHQLTATLWVGRTPYEVENNLPQTWFRLDAPKGLERVHPSAYFRTESEAYAQAERMGWTVRVSNC